MLELAKSKPGRDPDFRCTICGKYTSYDRRTVNVSGKVVTKYDFAQEQVLSETTFTTTHKKCEKKVNA